jgi:hypothetical protein
VNRIGIPVATPIAKVPADVQTLRALLTPQVSTATMNGESMPALVLTQAKARTMFYDLTSAPPVLRTADPAAAKITAGSAWKHASAIASYKDDELASILTYLRTAVKP